jgi:hypothetical protein
MLAMNKRLINIQRVSSCNRRVTSWAEVLLLLKKRRNTKKLIDTEESQMPGSITSLSAPDLCLKEWW